MVTEERGGGKQGSWEKEEREGGWRVVGGSVPGVAWSYTERSAPDLYSFVVLIDPIRKAPSSFCHLHLAYSITAFTAPNTKQSESRLKLRNLT